ncbi:MAG: hypothetical protein KF806_14250 [Nitrospira sp.]|nr:hypothetical protein [Fimbriimonadaceae bacterium]MBX3346489.1 hypothetical protein [Nitrospira sp.]
MRSLVRLLSVQCPRIDHLLRGWAVLWLLALPLFHIHPETHPHHGEAGHVHAVAIHTVFSGDVESEFGEAREGSALPAGEETGATFTVAGAHAWTTDPELSFSLLNDATERKPIKPTSTQVFVLAHHLRPDPVPHHQPYEDTWAPPALTPALVDIPARAPPSLPIA